MSTSGNFVFSQGSFVPQKRKIVRHSDNVKILENVPIAGFRGAQR